MPEPKQHVGYRLPTDLVTAITKVAKANGVSNTKVVEAWLSERATAEGWIPPKRKDNA